MNTKPILSVAALLTVAITASAETNPIIKDAFTADPATMVHNDTVYLYTGHDEAKGRELFTMKDWLCFTSKDMKTWTPHGAVLRATDFKWASQDAWAAQCVERNGKFYFYATVRGKTSGMSIGVAVSDSPTGPFVDARGSALITDASTPSPNGWDDIDPTVLIDDDGTAWMAWGNPNCYLVKLKSNMTELDGPIQRIHVPNYTEGPWLYKRNNLYYLVYAAFAHQGMSEKMCYATASKITGPWTYRGILTDQAKNSYTIHPAILDYKGQSYLFYHNAALTLNGETGATGRRAVCVDYLYFNPDGTLQPVIQTVEGVTVPPKANPTPVTAQKIPPASSSGLTVAPITSYDPTNWPGTPLVATAQNPYYNATERVSFNGGRGGSTNIAQTFVVAEDAQLQKIALFAGDGFGVSESNTVTVALYDLGTVAPTNASYSAETNLFTQSFGAFQIGKGLQIGYEAQAPGVLMLDFSGASQVTLNAGHTYALELQGTRGSAPLFWRRSNNKDTYPAGSAYANRTAITGRSGGNDFALAIYGVKQSRP